MATPATGARASRRAAASVARSRMQSDAPTAPAAEPTNIIIEPDVDEVDEMAEEAFGPDDVAPSATPTQTEAPDPRERPAFRSQSSTPLPQVASSPVGGALAMPQEDLTRKLDVGDLIIPKVRLSQAMSKTNTVFQTSKGSSGVQQGNWYHSTSSENLGEIFYFIPVDMRKSRALFVQGQGLMCRSFDMLNGEGDPGGACEGTYEERLTIPAAHRGCPLRLWNEKSPPKCGMTYNYPGLILRESDIEDPAKARPLQGILQLRSASSQAAKAINTFVMNEGMGVWTNVILEIGVETKTNPKGMFYVPTVDFYDSTDAEGFERIRRRAESMARQMGNQNLRSSIEDDDAA